MTKSVGSVVHCANRAIDWSAAGRLAALAAASLFLASGAIAAPNAASAAADDARDQRIARLEAVVAALQQRVEQDAVIGQQNAELKSEVGDLQAQVADLKSSTASQIQDVRQTAEAAPQVKFPNGRPTFATADGKFTASLRGVLQFDTAAYYQSAPGIATGAGANDFRRDGPAIGTSGIDLAHARDLKDGDLWRRARIGFDGTAFGAFDYRLLIDFAGAGVENAGELYEGWVQYSGLKPLKFRVGAFPPSDGLEDQGSTNGMPFLERPGASDVARNLAAGDTRTAAAIMGNGDHWFGSLAVTGRTIGVINTGTAAPTAQTFRDQLGLVGRAAFSPKVGDVFLHFGVHGSYVVDAPNVTGPNAAGVTPVVGNYAIRFNDTPELRVDGTKFIDTGAIPARHASEVGLEFAAQRRNLFLQSEYQNFQVNRTDGFSNPNFSAWYVEATWLITGETRPYNTGTAAFDAPPVTHPFKLGAGGGWGAWEIGVRYSDTDLNYHAGAFGSAAAADAVRGGNQRIWTAGVNWYLNPVVRVMLDVQHVNISRLSPSAAAYSTPVGAQIGQSYNTIAVRTQAAF